MPVLGAAKIAFMGAAKAAIGSETNPITSDADMLEWKNAQSGGRIGGPVWIKESSVNSGNAYEVYCEYKNSKCQALAAVFASSDSTISNGQGGKERWLAVKDPNGDGDWGQGTHTFNDNFDFYGYSTNDKSARTRIWFELAKNKTYLKFIGHSQNDDLFYTMTTTKAWGLRMKGSGNGGDGSNDYFANGAGGEVIRTASIITGVTADGGGTAVFQNSRWKNLGLGASDGEATDANSNDVIMIFANSTGSIGSGSTSYGGADQWTGIGAKRSQVSGNFAAVYTWNSNTGGTGQADSIAGNILDPGNHNGNIQFDLDAAILMFVPPF